MPVRFRKLLAHFRKLLAHFRDLSVRFPKLPICFPKLLICFPKLPVCFFDLADRLFKLNLKMSLIVKHDFDGSLHLFGCHCVTPSAFRLEPYIISIRKNPARFFCRASLHRRSA